MIVGFVCSSLTVTTQKVNAGSPWTPYYYLRLKVNKITVNIC